jgi:hypothetical protein
MKKIMVLLLMMISTLTLSACDLLGGDLNEIIDNVTNIAETFTMEDQTIEIGTENVDWAGYVEEINDNLPADINIEVVEDNIDYGVPGTYTVTLRLTAPDGIDFTHTFNVTVVEGGWTPEDILNGFEGDVTYLQTFMNPIMNSNAKETTTTLVFSVNEMDYETGATVPVTYTIESTSTVVQGNDMDIMSQEMILNMNGEIMPFSFYLVREDTALTFYLETVVLSDLFDDETVMEELGITEDYMMFTVEGDFASDEELNMAVLLEGLTGYLEDYMMDVDPEELAYVEEQIDYVVENINVFAKYLDLEYYMEQEGMTAELNINEEQQVEMTMTMATTMYGEIIDELLADIQNFAAGLDDVEVPNMSELPEYQLIMTILNGLQPMQVDALFDPASPTELSFALDLTSLVNTLAMITSGGEVMVAPVNELTINVVVRSGAEVTLPENATDMNEIVKDIMKLMFVQQVNGNINMFVSYLDWYEEEALPVDEEVTFNEVILMMEENEYYYYDMFEGVFDQDLSYIVNRGTVEEPMYYFNLVWADGANVFVGELGVEYLNNLIYNSEMITPIIELVNDDAFDISRLTSLME